MKYPENNEISRKKVQNPENNEISRKKIINMNME